MLLHVSLKLAYMTLTVVKNNIIARRILVLSLGHTHLHKLEFRPKHTTDRHLKEGRTVAAHWKSTCGTFYDIFGISRCPLAARTDLTHTSRSI